MRTTSPSSDSQSDDDDVPLKSMTINGYGYMEYPRDPNSYDSLCQHSIEACEFCDKISKNKYSSLIHNVRHIIIPLINQKVLQCTICLHHFTSEKDLRVHTIKKHPELTLAQILVKKEKEITPEKISQSENRTMEFENEKEENKIDSIKNRLVFEDDLILLDCNQLLNDLTTDCRVEMFSTPWLNNEEFSGKSVHYDELVKPGFYRCKKCGIGFPVRYDLIIHETSHITFKNSQVNLCIICKKYILGSTNDLKIHYLRNHKESIDNKKNSICHPEYFPAKTMPIMFGKEKVDVIEEKKVFNSKLHLCDLCFSFCKNNTYISYERIKSMNKLGKRYKCEKCSLKFFEINLVRRFVRRKVFKDPHKKNKNKTNEERLKTIANRFKKMKH